MKLLLHVCCAPDATIAPERLAGRGDVRLFFDNPNIQPLEEYSRRLHAFMKLVCATGMDYRIGLYDPETWFEAVRGHEADPEKGERCRLCVAFRLERTARQAVRCGFDTLGTVLTTSPHKDAAMIFGLGREIAGRRGLIFLEEDFKKRDGFKRSVQLCREWDIYRQNYCGCVYSIRK
ncbi:MAG: hypothetical protein C4524_04415 [Candidatus Zixiibacteriota bacterium]|nr:MAG: hypothetical protein C4524_04415 [candidate division Zixibacteria bacterium]